MCKKLYLAITMNADNIDNAVFILSPSNSLGRQTLRVFSMKQRHFCSRKVQHMPVNCPVWLAVLHGTKHQFPVSPCQMIGTGCSVT